MTVDKYRRNAAECLKLAETLSSPTNRAVLIEMAHAWQRLAERAERLQIADPRVESE
jgi:hypothetical protein